jgi:hypothetical protein
LAEVEIEYANNKGTQWRVPIVNQEESRMNEDGWTEIVIAIMDALAEFQCNVKVKDLLYVGLADAQIMSKYDNGYWTLVLLGNNPIECPISGERIMGFSIKANVETGFDVVIEFD